MDEQKDVDGDSALKRLQIDDHELDQMEFAEESHGNAIEKLWHAWAEVRKTRSIARRAARDGSGLSPRQVRETTLAEGAFAAACDQYAQTADQLQAASSRLALTMVLEAVR